MSIIRRSDDEEAPWLLDFSVLSYAEIYATAEEAEMFAAWWDHMTGGGSDLAEEIRRAIS